MNLAGVERVFELEAQIARMPRRDAQPRARRRADAGELARRGRARAPRSLRPSW